MSAADVIDPTIEPSGPACVERLATGGWWFHLRRCARCGHIGCCDSSPSQHASRHAIQGGHPVARSFEPVEGPELAPPQPHPLDQPTPGPEGRVPPDWRSHLH